MSDFYKHFKENMDALGLAAPESLFGTLQAAVATASTVLTQVDKFGPRVTVAELARLGSRLEQLAFLGSCCAAFYVGAVIGSIAVATGRSLADGTSIADVIFTASRYNLSRPWLISTFQRCPALYDARISARDTARYQVAIV